MAKPKLPSPSFWQSLFRNRRNNACCACVVLVGSFAAFWFIWLCACAAQDQLVPVPHSVLAVLSMVAGLKGWKDHVDSRGDNDAAPKP